MAQGSTDRAPLMARMGRITALKKAAVLFGGGRAAAEGLKVNERSWRMWIAGDREISNGVLCDTAAALEVHACKCREEAARLRELGGAAHLDKDAPTDRRQVRDGRLAAFALLPRDLQMRVANGDVSLEDAKGIANA